MDNIIEHNMELLRKVDILEGKLEIKKRMIEEMFMDYFRSTGAALDGALLRSVINNRLK